MWECRTPCEKKELACIARCAGVRHASAVDVVPGRRLMVGSLRPPPCNQQSYPPTQPPCRRVDVHDALKMGLADHAAEELSSEEVALRVAREIAKVLAAVPALQVLGSSCLARVGGVGLDAPRRRGFRSGPSWHPLESPRCLYFWVCCCMCIGEAMGPVGLRGGGRSSGGPGPERSLAAAAHPSPFQQRASHAAPPMCRAALWRCVWPSKLSAWALSWTWPAA